MIEGANQYGWFMQATRELEWNSTLPVSLAGLMNGDESSEHGLAVYLLGADEELLGCASMKKHDEDTAAEYDEEIFGIKEDTYDEPIFNVSEDIIKEDTHDESILDVSQETIKEDTSSGSKNGLFVFVSAIAAVGIAVVMGEVLDL